MVLGEHAKRRRLSQEDIPEDSSMTVNTPMEIDVPGKPIVDEKFLTCEVCYEIIHIAINCSPCNHKFCASCLYRWLDTHHTCPKCRYMIKDATRDVFADHVCEEYIKANPARARTKILKEMDTAELEYLEKLLKRSRCATNRRYPNPIDEEDERQAVELDRENYNRDRPRRLFMSTLRRYREEEWTARARRLREDLNLPPKELSPEPEERNARRRIHHPLQNMFRLYEGYPFFEDEDSESDEDDFDSSEELVPRPAENPPRGSSGPRRRLRVMRGFMLDGSMQMMQRDAAIIRMHELVRRSRNARRANPQAAPVNPHPPAPTPRRTERARSSPILSSQRSNEPVPESRPRAHSAHPLSGDSNQEQEQ